MSRTTKKKGKRPLSKAAQATAAKRAEREAQAKVNKPGAQPSKPQSSALPPPPGTDAALEVEAVQAPPPRSGGGMMMNMRSGFQSAVGQGEVEKANKSWINTVLWVAVVAAATFFFMGQFR